MRVLIIPEFGYDGEMPFTAEIIQYLSLATPNLNVFPVGALSPMARRSYKEKFGHDFPEKNKVLLNALCGMAYSAALTPEDFFVDIVIGIVPKEIELKFDQVYAVYSSLADVQVERVEELFSAAGLDTSFYKGEDVTFTGSKEEIINDIQRRTGGLPSGTA